MWLALADAPRRGLHESDQRVRFVLFLSLDDELNSVRRSTGMDVCNTGGKLAGSATAAIFLKRFVDGLIVDGSDNPNQEGLVRWCVLAHIFRLACLLTVLGRQGPLRHCWSHGPCEGRWRLQPQRDDWEACSHSHRVRSQVGQGLDSTTNDKKRSQCTKKLVHNTIYPRSNRSHPVLFSIHSSHTASSRSTTPKLLPSLYSHVSSFGAMDGTVPAS